MGQQESPTRIGSIGSIGQIYVSEGRGFRTTKLSRGEGTLRVTLDRPITFIEVARNII